jgi:hypothetical protein
MRIIVLDSTVTADTFMISASKLTASASICNVSDNMDMISTDVGIIRDNIDVISMASLINSVRERVYCEDIGMVSTVSLEISAW